MKKHKVGFDLSNLGRSKKGGSGRSSLSRPTNTSDLYRAESLQDIDPSRRGDFPPELLDLDGLLIESHSLTEEQCHQLLLRYNSALKHLALTPAGHASTNGIEINCHLLPGPFKRMVIRPTAMPSSRVSEVSITPLGTLTRWTLEWSEGPQNETDLLMFNGLSESVNDSESFAAFCHYTIIRTIMKTRGAVLSDVSREVAVFESSRLIGWEALPIV